MDNNIVRSFIISECVFFIYAMHLTWFEQITNFMALAYCIVYVFFIFITAPLNVLYIFLLSKTIIGNQMYTYRYICLELFAYIMGLFLTDILYNFISDPSPYFGFYDFFLFSLPSIVVLITFMVIIYTKFKKINLFQNKRFTTKHFIPIELKKKILLPLFISECIFLLYAMHMHSEIQKHYIFIYVANLLLIAPLNVVSLYMLSKTQIGESIYRNRYIFLETFFFLLCCFVANAVANFLVGPIVPFYSYIYYLAIIVALPIIMEFIAYQIFFHFNNSSEKEF